MNKVRAVLLDIDGTLLLSNDAHAQAFVDAAVQLGVPADFSKVRRLIGKGGDKLIPEAFGFEAESDLGKRLDALKGKIFKSRYLPTLQPAPGARALLIRFREDNTKLVVATSAGKEDVDQLLERGEVRDLIHDSASAEEVEGSKPEPDVVLAALKKAKEEPRWVIMLGDTPYDVEASTRAGVRIIAVRCGGWMDTDLQGAVAIYDDPQDLLDHYDESPFRIV